MEHLDEHTPQECYAMLAKFEKAIATPRGATRSATGRAPAIYASTTNQPPRPEPRAVRTFELKGGKVVEV